MDVELTTSRTEIVEIAAKVTGTLDKTEGEILGCASAAVCEAYEIGKYYVLHGARISIQDGDHAWVKMSLARTL